MASWRGKYFCFQVSPTRRLFFCFENSKEIRRTVAEPFFATIKAFRLWKFASEAFLSLKGARSEKLDANQLTTYKHNSRILGVKKLFIVSSPPLLERICSSRARCGTHSTTRIPFAKLAKRPWRTSSSSTSTCIWFTGRCRTKRTARTCFHSTRTRST